MFVMNINDFKVFHNFFEKVFYKKLDREINIPAEHDNYSSWSNDVKKIVKETLEYMWKFIEEIYFYWLDKK